MRRTTDDGAEPGPRSANVLTPLVALLAMADDKAASNFRDIFEDVACDWRLVRVADGKAAARHIMNKGLPDLLVTSANLPEVNGPDLVEWMRSFRRAGNVPVLVYGPLPDGDARQQFLRNEVKLLVPDDCPRQTLAGHLSRLVGHVETSRFPALA